jgi:hypothetical protein
VSDESSRLAKGSAARLLSDWRAAERDAVAAHEAADAATLATSAAEKASRAAEETAAAARLALEAATRAELAARETAEAARILAAGAVRDQAAADAKADSADIAETTARDAFREAQDAGFPSSGVRKPSSDD